MSETRSDAQTVAATLKQQVFDARTCNLQGEPRLQVACQLANQSSIGQSSASIFRDGDFPANIHGQ